MDVFVLNFLFVPRRAKFDRDRIFEDFFKIIRSEISASSRIKLKLKLNIPKLIFLIQFRSKIFRLLILSTIFKDNN